MQKQTGSVCIVLCAVLAIPNFGRFLDANCQIVALHVDDDPLLVRLDVSDFAQVAVCNRLTDVDHPFRSHLFVNLLLVNIA